MNNLSDVDPHQFFNYFSKLYSEHTNPKMLDAVEDNNDKLFPNKQLNTPFTITELKDQIQSLKNNKAAGVDGITNEMIKCAPESLLKVILTFF